MIASVLAEAIMSTFDARSLAARSGSRSSLPSAHRNTKTTLCLSTYPRSASACKNPCRARETGTAAGVRSRKPIRGMAFADCPSATSGAARSTAPVPARNVRRSITVASCSVEPSRLADAVLLGEEPRDALPYLAPRLRRPRKAEHAPEGHLHLEPGQVAGGLGAERETPGDGTACLVGWFHDGAIVAEGRPVGQRPRLRSLDARGRQIQC